MSGQRIGELVRSGGLPLAVLIVGIVLKVGIWASGRSLWLDEEMIGMDLRARGLGALAGRLDDDQVAPLGWLWLERLSVDLFGSGERALRLLPMLFMVGSAVVAYGFGRRFLHRPGAVTLVALVSFDFAFFTYADQLKHYSADAFWAIVLVAGAFWVLDDLVAPRRLLLWWGLAGLGSWLSIGGILVTPALALVLVGAVWARCGPRRAVLAGLPGLAWLASFVLHDRLSLRYATGSDYLATYWRGLGYPPSGAGAVGTLRWYQHQIAVLLDDPLHIGTGIGSHAVKAGIGAAFCLVVAAGLVVAGRRRPEWALVLLAPLVTAVMLAQFAVVPLSGRLAFWTVPAIAIAAAFGVDGAVDLVRRSSARADHGWRPVAERIAGVAVLLAAVLLVVPMVNGVRGAFAPPLLDDRSAIAAMQADHRPGDLTLLVAGATRAAQWYDAAGRLAPIVGVISVPAGRCQRRGLAQLAQGYRRIVAYAGVKFVPYEGTYQILSAQLAQLGPVRTRRFGTGGTVYTVDIGQSGLAALAPAGSPAQCIVAQ